VTGLSPVQIAQEPRKASPPMTKRSVLPTELAHGQFVIVIARWLLVFVGLLVALWNPDPLPQLRIQIGVVLLVAIANFVMHAQLLRRRPTIEAVATAASIGDLLVISVLVLSQGGFGSNVFVFYFPAVLAIAVAFPTRQAAMLSAAAVALAIGVSMRAVPGAEEVLLRALAIGAVAVIGNAYWRLHRNRIQPSRQTSREDAHDLFWGQVATLWARWAVIVGGAVIVLSRSASTTELAVGILPVVILLLANFYLHGRYLMERPANALLTLLASGLDLVMVAVLFVTWSGTGGLSNPSFLYLYPLMFSVGLVFPPRVSWGYAGGALLLYMLLVLHSGLSSQGDMKVLLIRLVTLAAMGGLGSLYWRIVRRETRIGLEHEMVVSRSLASHPAGAS
jgi:hypothetical protein